MAETAVQCPWCPAVITVPIEVILNGDDGQQFMVCEPDLTDVWAHAWTHDGKGDGRDDAAVI